jgi:hypothetical protein
MAVFLLKTKHGAAYLPPNCAGIFADVTCPGAIEELYNERDYRRLFGESASLLPPRDSHTRPDGGIPREDV